MESLAARLRHLRTRDGLTQQELADLLGVSRATVASWETGRRVPGSGALEKIAAKLNADKRELARLADAGRGASLGERPVMLAEESYRTLMRTANKLRRAGLSPSLVESIADELIFLAKLTKGSIVPRSRRTAGGTSLERTRRKGSAD